MFTAGGNIGSPFVVTSNNGGHSPEQVAELCVNRLIQVADTAPPELAQQARAFREQMLAVVLHYVKVGIAEDRKTVSEKLNSAGYAQLAQQIKDL
jgi:hypothetical protein